MTTIVGSEKLKHGYSALAVIVNPGAKEVQASIPLPAWAKGAQHILQAVKFKGSTGSSKALATTLKVVTETPSTGEILLYDEDNVRLGDATTTRDILLLVLKYKTFSMKL